MRRKIITDTLSLNVASLISQAVGILQTLLIMRFLDPHYYGIWLGLNIVLMYGTYANLGIEYGLGIRLPYYRGQNKIEEASKLQDSGYFAWSALTIISSLGVLIYAIGVPGLSFFERTGLAVIAVLMIAEQQISFLGRWQNAALKDFRMVSILLAARSMVTFCVLVPLTYFFNVNGLMGGVLLVAVLFTVIWWMKTSYRYEAKLSWASFLEMIRVGFPILLVAIGGRLIETVDRILILTLLGPMSLGYYGVTSLGGNALYGLVSQAGGAISVHISEDFGRNNDFAPALKKYLVKPTLIFAYIMTALMMGLAFSLPPLVLTFLPKYIPGLNAFYCFIPGFFFLGIVLTANNILNIILISHKRQRWVVYLQALVCVIEVGLGYWFIKLGWSIAGVALASTLAYAVYGSVIIWWASRYVLPDWGEHLLFMGDVITPFILGISMTWLIYWFGHTFIPDHLVLRNIIQLVICFIMMLPLAYWLDHKTGIFIEGKSVVDSLMRKIKGDI